VSSLDLTTVRKAPRAIALVVFSLLAAPLAARAYDPDGLWKVVSTKCVPNQRDTGNPAPCIEVNVSKGVDSGFLVLKDSDPLKPYEYLLIPTQPITGIESKKVPETGAPNYFEDAWAARSYLTRRISRPRAASTFRSCSSRVLLLQDAVKRDRVSRCLSLRRRARSHLEAGPPLGDQALKQLSLRELCEQARFRVQCIDTAPALRAVRHAPSRHAFVGNSNEIRAYRLTSQAMYR
jgi:hypothetical protein